MFVISAEINGKTVYFRGMADGTPLFDKFGSRTKQYKTRQGAVSNVIDKFSKSYIEANKIQVSDVPKKRSKTVKKESSTEPVAEQPPKEPTAAMPQVEQSTLGEDKPSVKHWIEMFKFGPLVLYMYIDGNRFAMLDDTKRFVDLGSHKLFAWRQYWATVNRVMETRIGDELERQGKDRFGRDQFGDAQNGK